MAYELGIAGAPETVPPGSGVLLVHPTTVDADEVDTRFLADNDDPVLVVSTHSAASEVGQKLEHYGIDRERVEILDAISVERGYTRRQHESVTYVASPEDLEGITAHVEDFLDRQEGHARLTVDSLTELLYYGDGPQVRAAIEDILDLLEAEAAVGLFHATADARRESLDAVQDAFYGVGTVDEDGAVGEWS